MLNHIAKSSLFWGFVLRMRKIGLDCEMGWNLLCFFRLLGDDLLSYVAKRLCFLDCVL